MIFFCNFTADIFCGFTEEHTISSNDILNDKCLADIKAILRL